MRSNEPESVSKYRYYGGPADRGSADAYYGRPKRPHKFPNGTYTIPEVTDLTEEELAAYNWSYDNQDDRKDWGY